MDPRPWPHTEEQWVESWSGQIRGMCSDWITRYGSQRPEIYPPSAWQCTDKEPSNHLILACTQNTNPTISTQDPVPYGGLVRRLPVHMFEVCLCDIELDRLSIGEKCFFSNFSDIGFAVNHNYHLWIRIHNDASYWFPSHRSFQMLNVA